MPSDTEPMRRLMGMALREKREGKGSSGSPRAKRIARGMSESQLADFARKSPKGRAKRKARRATKRSYRK